MTLWLGIADNELIVADADDDLALFTAVAETNHHIQLQLYHNMAYWPLFSVTYWILVSCHNKHFAGDSLFNYNNLVAIFRSAGNRVKNYQDRWNKVMPLLMATIETVHSCCEE